MGKKFLLVLFSLFIFAGSAFAYSNPRWSIMPISVYLPKRAESFAVTEAFKTWQASTKCVRFLYKNSANMAPISNINVIFKDTLPGESLYRVSAKFPQVGNCRVCVRDKFFYHTDIYIALKDENGKLLTAQQIKAVAMQAVGVAVGVSLNDVENSVMFKDSEFKTTALTKDDIKSVYKIYRSGY